MGIASEIAKDTANPIRLYAEIAAVILLGIAFVWYRHSLIAQGERNIKDLNAQLAAEKIVHNAEVETRAKTLAESQLAVLKETLAAPPATDAPHVSCVSNRPRVRTVPKDARTSAGVNAGAQQPSVVAAVPERPWDIGPDVDKRFQDDDALILALQQRIQNEVGVCR